MVKLVRIIVVITIPLLLALWFYSYLNKQLFLAYQPNNINKILIELEPGTTLSQFCNDLQREGVIRSAAFFKIVATMSGKDKNLKAGEYELSASMTPQEILNKLSIGDVFKRILTIKEGWDIWQIADELEVAKILDREIFLDSVQDREFIEKFELDEKAKSLEGYLYPETYHFSGRPEIRSIIWTLLEQFVKNWKPEYTARLKELNMTMHEIITLASIIEKESGNFKEQPFISSVFHNRLKSNMMLQSDPTLVYGVKDFNGVVLNKHKAIDSPYNTYMYIGLPPGPIANPGSSAIRAALYPEQSDYLYFVADGQGGHVFSENLADHNKAVRRYRSLMKSRQ